MKAVVLETRKNEAAVLCKDGQIVKIRRKGLVAGQTIELSDAEIRQDKKVVFYKKLRQYGSVAAAAALLLGFGGNHIYNTAIACSYVSLDINPSIEYTLNRQDCVLDVTAVNEDAEEIVEQLKEQGIKKESLADAISMTADLLQENGYITEAETDYILINVASDSDKRSETLKKEAQSVFDKINTENEDNIHLTMTESTISERKEARSQGVSAGEYKEIQSIGDEDVSKYKDMKVKELLENSGQLKKDASDTKQAESFSKESGGGAVKESEEKDKESTGRNTDANAENTQDDGQKNGQRTEKKESQQNDSSSKENNTEANQNSRSKETMENQPSQNTDRGDTERNNTGQNTQEQSGQSRNDTAQSHTEQPNTDNNTGNFGQPSGNSHVEDAQNSERTLNEAGPNQ